MTMAFNKNAAMLIEQYVYFYVKLFPEYQGFFFTISADITEKKMWIWYSDSLSIFIVLLTMSVIDDS